MSALYLTCFDDDVVGGGIDFLLSACESGPNDDVEKLCDCGICFDADDGYDGGTTGVGTGAGNVGGGPGFGPALPAAIPLDTRRNCFD